jgi:hypothetical protein
MKHIVCYSGGHSSGLVAIEVFRKFGKDNLILLNHDINSSVEDADIKRFKKQVADWIGVSITYANMVGVEHKDQFDVVVEAQAFKVGTGTALCTDRLKTRPFEKWLSLNCADKDCIIYYGFDKNETARIQRRASHLGALGYKTDFPLAFWERTIQSTEEVGIDKPLTYYVWKHANCLGCLKAGRQHWYAVYCLRPDLWERGKWAEDEIEYTIIKGVSLLDLEPLFARMKAAGIEPTEKVPAQTFWKRVRDRLKEVIDDDSTEGKPCECIV